MNLVVIIVKMMIQNDNFMVKLYQMKRLIDWSDAIGQFRKETFMKNNIIQSEMDVKGSKINVVRVNGITY